MSTDFEKARKIILDYKQKGRRSEPMEPTLELIIPSPEAAAFLLQIALVEMVKDANFLDTAIALLPDGEFPNLVTTAIKSLSDNRENELAQSVIHYASLQSLESVHLHLTAIFELAPNQGTYYDCWPWRESGLKHFDYLHDKFIDSSQDEEVRFRAWNALLETRDLEALAFALTQAPNPEIYEMRYAYLLDVGFEHPEPGFRQLYSDTVYHIIFDTHYLRHQYLPDWRKLILQNQATWKLTNIVTPPLNFGGVSTGSCLFCDGQLHHLITLESIPSGLPISELDRLELATCLNCLEWQQHYLFYKHDESGKPSHVGYSSSKIAPQFPAVPFLPTTVHLATTPVRWKWQGHASSNGRENLHRVGGYPCWIQSADYPTCPECDDLMRFLLQLDSDIPTVDGGEWMWGDSGMCYVFWCNQCKVSGYLSQYY